MKREQIERKIKLYENKISLLDSIEKQAKEKVLSRVERNIATRKTNYETALKRLKEQLANLQDED